METLEQCVKPVQRSQQRHQNDVIDIIVFIVKNDFIHCSRAFIFDREQENGMEPVH